MRSLLTAGVSLAASALASARQEPIHTNQIGPGVKRTWSKPVLANLSRYHPDYGMTPAQHEQAKAEREAGKRRFIPKEDLKAHRRGLLRSMGL